MLIPTNVFIAESASAPPFSAATPIAAISVTLGLNFMINRRSVNFRRRVVSCSVRSQSTPNSIPPAFTFGHDIFISYPTIFEDTSSVNSNTSQYSSSVLPAIFMMIGVLSSSYKGIIFLMYASTPIFANPIELSMPDGVSTIRGGGFPSRG